MSSTVSSTEIQTLSINKMSSTLTTTTTTTQNKTAAAKSEGGAIIIKTKLARTTSLEKIRRFNSYLCTQHYYILPAILAWFKSSQTVLKSATDKTIHIFRSIIFNQLIYRLIHLDFVNLLETCLKYYLKFMDFIKNEEIFFLRLFIPIGCALLLLQLTMCCYLLFQTVIPGGLIFLICCMLYINYLHCSADFYFVNSKADLTKQK